MELRRYCVEQSGFAQRWVRDLVESMDEHLDQDTKVRLMESCGRACARAQAVTAARACEGDLEQLLSTLGRWIGSENVQKDGDAVHVVYQRCFCPLMGDEAIEVPGTYCLCSRGWLKEMFETVVARPVEVELVESIKRGADQCRFTVRL